MYLLAGFIILFAFPQAAAARAACSPQLPAPFVYLKDIDPTILQDMRYAAASNFTGAPVPGYEAAECILLRPAAEALRRAQTDLKSSGQSLKVYDCYRPERAVRAFAAWAKRRDGADKTGRHHPRIQRRQLFALGYIAEQSGHSRGAAVDLTVVALPPPPPAPFSSAAAYGPCTAPSHEREPDNSIDMGTGFDCFDQRSHTASTAVTAEQRRARHALAATMARHGFKNYSREWWHFTFSAAQAAGSYGFPIRPRRCPT